MVEAPSAGAAAAARQAMAPIAMGAVMRRIGATLSQAPDGRPEPGARFASGPQQLREQAPTAALEKRHLALVDVATSADGAAENDPLNCSAPPACAAG